MSRRRQLDPTPAQPPAVSPADTSPNTAAIILAHHPASPLPSPTPLRRLRVPSSHHQETAATNRDDQPSAPRRARFAEVAGGAAASCTAVCCCCPCGLLNLLVLVFVRLPAGLCKKAIKKRRRNKKAKMKRKMRALSPALSDGGAAAADRARNKRRSGSRFYDGEDDAQGGAGTPGPAVYTEDMRELEREMWDRFHKAGFWRSQSLET